MSDTPDDVPLKRLASTSATEAQDATEVARVRSRPKVTTGKPKRLPKTAGMKLAYGVMSAAGTTSATAGNFYSPELSTDFLELPQSLYEQWNYYRFFYRKNPFVGQALDLHTELPLSKVRLNIPKAKNRELALQATEWCERWARRIGLLHRLLAIVHEWHLIGEVFVWCEDANPEMPEDLMYEEVNVIVDGDDGTGEARTERRLREDQSAAVDWLKKNYKGWTSIRCLPPEQTHMEAFNFTDEKLIELVPDAKTKKIIEAADSGDTRAQRVVGSMPTDIVEAVRDGRNIPLNTDPEAGSFVHYLANKKSDYEPRGHSVLERCLQSLVHFDKLRQANASIASRHMTPIRIVYAEDMAASDTEALREQVDLALQDPDFSIIANFQITWEEMGSDQRLLDLSGEMDLLARELYAGLGVTEGLLTGESSYSGDKISLEVINTRYMLLREILQDFTEEYLFKPMCKRMGFIEVDDDGNEQVVYPRLSFTRLALRDNADTFDSLFNLYQKGSLDIDVILELLNIDPVTTREKLERDFFTPNDSTFNEVLRNMYGDVGRKLVEETDVVPKVAKNLGLKHAPPKEEGGGRFG
jgi:hypothetical protein